MRGHQSDPVAQEMLESRLGGFQKLFQIYPDSLTHILECATTASVFSADFDQIIRCYSLPKEEKQRISPNIALVKFTRWCVLHDVLSLPAPAKDHELVQTEEIVAELCRLILLAYALFAVVPMPPESKLHGRITAKLNRLLHKAVQTPIPSTHGDLFLCAIGWAFMCAHKAIGHRSLGKLLTGYVDLLEYQEVVKLDNSEWQAVTDVMKSFLWLDSYCDGPGQKFWACACGIAQKNSQRD
jgi:hypothetical protein